jgi:hypothetical protein
LAEKRPSLLYGDRVILKYPGQKIEYEGFVHVVERDSVGLKFHERFHQEYIRNKKVNVRFTFTKTPLKRLHQVRKSITNSIEITAIFHNKNNYSLGSYVVEG